MIDPVCSPRGRLHSIKGQAGLRTQGAHPQLIYGNLAVTLAEPRTKPSVRNEGALTSVTTVVISHNEGVLLERTVRLLLQTMPNGGEVVVVDDESTDGSTDFLNEGQTGLLRRVELIRTPRRFGVSAARNLGASRARGDVVVFSDAHVEPPPGWAQHFVEALADPVVGAVGPAIGVMGDDKNVGYGRRWKDATLSGQWLPRQQGAPYQVPMLGGAFLAMRRDVLDVVQGFDPGMIQWGGEDLELCARLWMLGHECVVLPDVLVTHLFRRRSPSPPPWELVVHNLLRTAVVHFDRPNLSRVIASLRSHPAFPQALARLMGSDVWERTKDIRKRRKYDDIWFLSRFHMDLPPGELPSGSKDAPSEWVGATDHPEG